MNCRWKLFAVAAFALILALTNPTPSRADVKLPHIISDHMVLQRDTRPTIWGWADPSEDVTATIAGQTISTQAWPDGRWYIILQKITMPGPHTLIVKGKNSITVNDVLVGEVWLASGQSNMAWRVRQAKDFDKEKGEATYPQMRTFTVPGKTAREPQKDCDGKWVICSPETVGDFSAAAYFFGKDLHEHLKTPVGLINSSVGGTPIESWISMDAQKSRTEMNDLFATWEKRAKDFDPEKAKENYEKAVAAHKVAVEKAKAENKPLPRAPGRPGDPRDNNHHPASLYNAMIAPLAPYTVKGAIWYQGESNAGSETSGALYAIQLPLMIQNWRSLWNQVPLSGNRNGEFHFAWVQLPNFNTGAKWPYVREAMLKSLSVPNTGMTINMDIGDPADIHPKNKQDIGHRLALWARARAYGENIPYSGPLPAGHRQYGEGIEVFFKHAEGLTAKGGDVLKGFEIAGADQRFVPAKARIEGDRVFVSSPDVKQPVAVRYAWANNPECNLFNGAGLPASPFRTDDWKEPVLNTGEKK